MEQNQQQKAAGDVTKQRGSCHCGAVKFEVAVDLSQGASRCNCSVCTKSGSLGNNVKPEAFTLLGGEDSLSSYEWGHKVSKRYFCKHCGILCFLKGDLPELGGAFVSINYNAFDDIELGELKVGYWDGRHDNWEGGMRSAPWPIHRAG